MAERGKKDSTPPPLLLMPAGGGLTLNPPSQPDVLMPVIQSEASLLSPEEEGEADSFLGQSPVSSSQPAQPAEPSTYALFQQQTTAADPFSQIGQQGLPPPAAGSNPSNPSVSGAQNPPLNLGSRIPPVVPSPIIGGEGSTPQRAAADPNFYRKPRGPARYAQPPPGTYANTGIPPQQPGQYQSPVVSNPSFQPPPASGSPFPPPASSSPFPPPVSSGTPYQSAPSGSPFPTPQTASGYPYQSDSGPAVMSPMANISTPPLSPASQPIYQPVEHHWCFSKRVELREVWYPLSIRDSMNLEEVYRTGSPGLVPTSGGRYDVDVAKRLRMPVYWEEDTTTVRRCSWFYKREGDNKFVPFGEDFAAKLEEEYKNAIMNNVWHKRLEFAGGETIVMHNPNVIVHFQAASSPDEWGNVQSVYSLPGDQMRPRVVRRGVEEFEGLRDGEVNQVDHIVFVVHGIGSFCDMKFRSMVECVDDFRSLSINLLQSHFKPYLDEGRIGRVEFLPVHWHGALHGDDTGIDRRLKTITLPSSGKLRSFVNDTLLDILFYTSPTYCETIAKTVGSEINRLYQLFLSRNPTFQGTSSVAGHSLGSSILFDLLRHQREPSSPVQIVKTTITEAISEEPSTPEIQVSESDVLDTEEKQTDEPELTLEELLAKVGLQEKVNLFKEEQIDMESLIMCSEADLKDLGLPMGPRKKLQGFLKEEQDKKNQQKQRSEKLAREEVVNKLREEQKRKEEEEEDANQLKVYSENNLERKSSVSVNYIFGLAGTGQPFVKYPRLDFQPCAFFAMGSPIGVFSAVQGIGIFDEDFRLPTCPRVFNIFHPYDPVAYRLEPLINPAAANIKPVLMPHHKGRKRLHLELKESLSRVGADLKQKILESLKSTWNSINDFARAHRSAQDNLEQEVDSMMQDLSANGNDKAETGSIASSHDDDISMGQLNEGRRIDYALQEKPIESFNDYLFSLSSHGCYWESEDTVLMFLKELYSPAGIAPHMPGPDSHPKTSHVGPPPMGTPKGPPGTSQTVPQNNFGGPVVNVSSPHGGVRPAMMTPQWAPPQGGIRPGIPSTLQGPQQGGISLQQEPPQGTPSGPPPMGGFARKS